MTLLAFLLALGVLFAAACSDPAPDTTSGSVNGGNGNGNQTIDPTTLKLETEVVGDARAGIAFAVKCRTFKPVVADDANQGYGAEVPLPSAATATPCGPTSTTEPSEKTTSKPAQNAVALYVGGHACCGAMTTRDAPGSDAGAKRTLTAAEPAGGSRPSWTRPRRRRRARATRTERTAGEERRRGRPGSRGTATATRT